MGAYVIVRRGLVAGVSEPARERQGARKQRPILLVEDNPDDEELMRRALHRSNIVRDVVAANDGAEALDYLFKRVLTPRETLASNRSSFCSISTCRVPRASRFSRQIRSNERTRLLAVGGRCRPGDAAGETGRLSTAVLPRADTRRVPGCPSASSEWDVIISDYALPG